MLGGGGSAPTTRIAAPGSGGSGSTAQQACATDAASRAACNAFSSADNTWEAIFARAGERFQVPKLVFYAGNGQSGCGAAPSDRKRSVEGRSVAVGVDLGGGGRYKK